MKKGEKFNKLTAVKPLYRNNHGGIYWLFKCECGKHKAIISSSVTSGVTNSCGCLRNRLSSKRLAVHGMSGTSFYCVWKGMLKRCNNKKEKNYHNYGGRGIKVCKRWHKFENFYADMGNKPDGKSLDRIDNDGDYCPKNCRWATCKEQSNNTRTNIFVSLNGINISFQELSEIFGLKKYVLYNRLYVYSWDIERALKTKSRSRNRK